MEIQVPDVVAQRRCGNHTVQVLSSFILPLFLLSLFTFSYGHSLSFLPHPMFLQNYMCSPTPSFFVCTRIFVLQFGLLVLYKYWPMPTCIFFSLIIISLCWLHSPAPLETTLYSLFTQRSEEHTSELQ